MAVRRATASLTQHVSSLDHRHGIAIVCAVHGLTSASVCCVATVCGCAGIDVARHNNKRCSSHSWRTPLIVVAMSAMSVLVRRLLWQRERGSEALPIRFDIIV